MRNVTDREALMYLAGLFEAVIMGPRFSDVQLVMALFVYRGFADHLPRRDEILAEAIVRNEASDVPERRGLALRLKRLMADPPKFLKEDE